MITGPVNRCRGADMGLLDYRQDGVTRRIPAPLPSGRHCAAVGAVPGGAG